MSAARRATLSLAAAATAVLLAGPPAAADPGDPGDAFDLVCGSTTYRATVNGNGDWTPAHDLNSTRVLVPVAFGPFQGVVSDAQGNVLDTFTDPPSTKGSGKAGGKPLTSCTFTFNGSETDPETGETIFFTGTGSVQGFVTPRR